MQTTHGTHARLAGLGAACSVCPGVRSLVECSPRLAKAGAGSRIGGGNSMSALHTRTGTCTKHGIYHEPARVGTACSTVQDQLEWVPWVLDLACSREEGGFGPDPACQTGFVLFIQPMGQPQASYLAHRPADFEIPALQNAKCFTNSV